MSKVEELAGEIKLILSMFDTIDDEELDLLDKTVDMIRNRISHNEAALPIIYAMGGQYDSKEDTLKEEELKIVIRLVRLRREYRKFLEDNATEQARNRDVLKLFGL